MGRFVALLRGINVGGKNLIRMPALVACFEAQGLTDVSTYIQSGNVLFSAREGAATLSRRLEAALAAAFSYRATVMLRSQKQLADIVAGAPRGFGTQPAKVRCDVIFLKAPLTAAAALKDLPLRDGVDQAHAGAGVLYASRLVSRASQSRIGRLVSMPMYKSMTIRNWNTTTALARLL